jgi:hypothetical protein
MASQYGAEIFATLGAIPYALACEMGNHLSLTDIDHGRLRLIPR